MKKIMKLCLVGILSFSLFGCFGSSDEKDAKKFVSSYLDLLGDGDLEGIVKLTGDTTLDISTVNQTDSFKKSVELMVKKLDYSITDVTINEDTAILIVDVSNVEFPNLRTKAIAKVQEEVENIEELSTEEQETKVLEKIEALLPDEALVEQTVEVYLAKDGDNWKFTGDNAKLFSAVLGY